MTTYGDSVPVTQKGLNLFLIVDVPYAHDAVLAPETMYFPLGEIAWQVTSSK